MRILESTAESKKLNGLDSLFVPWSRPVWKCIGCSCLRHNLLGKTDLTNLNITLLKAYRNIEQSSNKRVCLEIISDVLLRYGAEATRRWISELITDMVSKGFAILTVLNPAMHPSDQVAAVVDFFDGEISLYQTEDPLECKKFLRVKKLRNQDYIKNSICLT